MTKAEVVEYYLVRDGGFVKFEWEGPDPSFVLVALFEEALQMMGVFDADTAGVWPATVGTPWFLVPAAAAGELAEVCVEVPWRDFLTPARVRDSLGVREDHAAAMADLAMVESVRLTELLRAAADHDADLLCIVY